MQRKVIVPDRVNLQPILDAIQPYNFLEFRGIPLWSSAGRKRGIFMLKVLMLARDLGMPLELIKNRNYLQQDGKLYCISQKQWGEFVAACFDRYGIHREDQENILDNHN
jgi:hypothetical protein